MIVEAAQAAQEAAKHGGAATETLIGLGILIVSNVGLWLDKFVQMSRARADREKSEADEAEAKAAAVIKPANGNGVASLHEKYVLPHSLSLERHDMSIQTLKAATEKLEKENREDHGKIFAALDDIKSLIIGKSAGAA